MENNTNKDSQNTKRFLYCRDTKIKEKLLSQNMTLLNTISSSSQETWVFEYIPSLFSLDFNNMDIKNKCCVTDKLFMAF